MSNSENPNQSGRINLNSPGDVNIGGDIVGRDKNTTTTATTTTTTTNIEGGPVARYAVIGLIAIAALAIILAFIVIALFALRGSSSATPTPSSTRDAKVVSATETSSPTAPTLGIGSTQVSEMDGMVQVYIPAGEFLMGSTDVDTKAESDEKPYHTVYLDTFWIDKTEVTNTMYMLCVAAGVCPYMDTDGKPYGDSEYNDYPVANVSWYQAQSYCEWAGRRLPTEAEWEKAARGTDGRIYPWGNAAPDSNLLNFNRQVGQITKVGSYPNGASPYGALDMAGNVWEWVNDWYNVTYYGGSPSENPPGPSSGQYKVLRGGSWYDEARSVRAAFRIRNVPGLRSISTGFRCARSP